MAVVIFDVNSLVRIKTDLEPLKLHYLWNVIINRQVIVDQKSADLYCVRQFVPKGERAETNFQINCCKFMSLLY